MKSLRNTPKDNEIALLYASTWLTPAPKKIKLTHKFYNCIVAKFTNDVIHEKDDSPRGYYTYFAGIPIEIDDTIENEDYELVY